MATQLLLVLLALVANLVVRWSTLDDLDTATRNAADVLAVERRLGLDWEHALHDVGSDVPGVATVSAWYYVLGYLPPVALTLVWLYLRHRPRYRLLRNALLVSGAVGLLGYAFYPTAPPRLTEVGLGDPVARTALQEAARPAGIANELGAMPSFHVGWLALAAVCAALVVGRRWLRALLLLQPVLMSFAVVVTANHWVLDVPAGLLAAAVGFEAARRHDRPHGPPSRAAAATVRG